MRTSTVVVGLFFGAILAGMLAAPLYVSLPARYVSDWFYVTPQAALIGLVAALAAVVSSGFLAATFDDEEAVRSGTTAGLLSTIVAGILVALPAAEIEACGSLLSIAQYDTMTAEMLRRITAETAVDGVWIPAMAGLALLLIGPALGAVGGVIYDLWQGSPGRSTRTIRRSIVPLLGLGGVLGGVAAATMWAVHLDITVLPRLEHPPGWGERTGLSSPLLVASAATCLLLSWAIRDVIATWREEARLLALVWGSITVTLPIAMGAVVVVLHPRSLVTPGPWIAALAITIAAGASVFGASRSERPLERQPRAFGEVVGEALLSGIVIIGSLMFVSGASIVGTWVIAFPYVLGLLTGAELVNAPPADLVSQVFSTHWLAALLIFLTTALYLGCMGPLWAFGRVVGRS